MITGTKEELDKIAQDYVCSEHKTPVVVAWHAGENSYVLRCGQGHFPDEVTRQMSPTEEHKVGNTETPKPISSLLPRTDLSTGEMLSPDVIKGLIAYALKYNLDPYRGHVVLMYGKPYITIDAYLYHAKRSNIAYRLKSHPLTNEERKQYMVGDEDHAWLATVELVCPPGEFTGLGVVTKEETEELAKGKQGVKRYPVVAAKPWMMAQKRAEWQALRRAFPIGDTGEKEEE